MQLPQCWRFNKTSTVSLILAQLFQRSPNYQGGNLCLKLGLDAHAIQQSSIGVPGIKNIIMVLYILAGIKLSRFCNNHGVFSVQIP